MQEKYIDVNGIRTRYASAGDKRPALILLHGLGASLESWWYNVDALGEHFRVIAPDIVYFGKSAKPQREPDQLAFVEFTMGLMDTMGIERAVLVGNSMGGAIAAKAAMMYPERVPALVLVNAAGFGQEVAWWLRLRSVIDARPQGKPPAWLIRIGLKQIFDDPDRVSGDVIEKLVAMDQDPEAQAAYRRVLTLGVDWRGLKPEMLREIRDAAHQISVPTLIVWGKQDRVVPVRHAKVAHSKIPNARLHLFDNCGHTPQLEYPEEFNTLIRDFVHEMNAA
jgi:pimeloyl-ACP methyl ester carboxylesterase